MFLKVFKKNILPPELCADGCVSKTDCIYLIQENSFEVEYYITWY